MVARIMQMVGGKVRGALALVGLSVTRYECKQA